MLTFQYQKGPFKIIESIGQNDIVAETGIQADVFIKLELLLSRPEKPIVKGGFYKNSFELNIPNFLIDLKQTEEEIYKKIHKSTRADIRKAKEINQFSYIENEHPTDEQIKQFSTFFNLFAKEKGIPLCNIKKLHEIRNNDSLVMTSVADKQNNILCAGMLIIDREYSQLYGLYGVSSRLSKMMTREEKALIGRANKYLQWKEIQSAKNRGMDWYNFGGEVSKKEDKGVNDFKRRFGTIYGYDRKIYVPKSMLGRVCVYLLYLKWKRIIPVNRSKPEVRQLVSNNKYFERE